jgi:hypothetical protein
MTDHPVPPRTHPAPADPPPDPTGGAERRRTCAACGGPIAPGARYELEVFSDGEVRYLAVHPGHTTFSAARERAVADRLRRLGNRTGEAA